MRASLAHRPRPVRRAPLRPMAGQLFEVTVTPDALGYEVVIPEIDAVTRVERRADAEVSARACIAARTGIPVNFVAVWVRD
ncbi:long chain fatty acid-CoA synthetase [Mycolicibacterium grossiae]|nr:long chain fatty acid-CoA synthetase [Mycolicibacterium grossiae]